VRNGEDGRSGSGRPVTEQDVALRCGGLRGPLRRALNVEGEENLMRGARTAPPAFTGCDGSSRAKRSDSEGEMKSTRGVFRCRQVPGSEPGEDGKGRVERLKVEAGAANQYAATRVRADPAGTINFTRACPGG
jgi:hypothetical protein